MFSPIHGAVYSNSNPQRLFTLGFSHQVNNAKSFVDDTIMSGLEYCDELLSREIGENILTEDKLGELQAQVLELINEIEESNLHPEL